MPESAWSGNELIANRGPQVQAPVFSLNPVAPVRRAVNCAPSQSPATCGYCVWRSGEKKT